MSSEATIQSGQNIRRNAVAVQRWADPNLPTIPVSGWVDVDAGIDATGATDATDALNSYFAGLSTGAKVRFPVDGTYRVDGTITIDDFDTLSIDGRGSTFQTALDGASGRVHLELNRCNDVYITDLHIQGPTTLDPLLPEAYDAELENQHGLSIRGCTTVLIDSCSVSDVWGDWVYIGKDQSTNTTGGHITIRDSTFVDCSRQGFAVVAGANILITGNTCGDGRRAHIDLEPNGAPGIQYVKIIDNTFGESRLLFLANKGAVADVSNIWVEGNTIGDEMAIIIDPPASGLRSNWVIINNTSLTAHGTPNADAVRANYVDGLVVRYNTQPMQAGRNMVMVGLESCTNWQVSDNTGANMVAQFRIKGVIPVFGSDPTGDNGPIPEWIGTGSGVSTSPTLTLTLPAAAAAGDLAVVNYGREGTEPTNPAGWTELHRAELFEPPATSVWMVTMWKLLTSDDITAGDIDITLPVDASTTNRSAGLVQVFRDAGIPYGLTSIEADDNAADLIVPGPVLTSRGLVVYSLGQKNGNGTWSIGEPQVENIETVKNDALRSYNAALGSAPVLGVGKAADRLWSNTQKDQSAGCAFVLPFGPAGSTVTAVRPTFPQLLEASHNVPVSISATFTGDNTITGVRWFIDRVGAPVLVTDPPSISGLSYAAGNELTAMPAGYSGNEPIVLTYQWYSDDVAISGATDPTFTPTASEVGTDVHVVETATNAAGSLATASATVAVTAAEPAGFTILDGFRVWMRGGVDLVAGAVDTITPTNGSPINIGSTTGADANDPVITVDSVTCDGINDYLEFNAADKPLLDVDDSFTVVLALKAPTRATDQRRLLFSTGASTFSGNGFHISTANGSDKLLAELDSDQSDNVFGETIPSIYDGNLWVIVGRVSPTYVSLAVHDGTEAWIESKPRTTGDATQSGPAYLFGRFTGAPAEVFSAAYDQQWLSAAEIDAVAAYLFDTYGA